MDTARRQPKKRSNQKKLIRKIISLSILAIGWLVTAGFFLSDLDTDREIIETETQNLLHRNSALVADANFPRHTHRATRQVDDRDIFVRSSTLNLNQFEQQTEFVGPIVEENSKEFVVEITDAFDPKTQVFRSDDRKVFFTDARLRLDLALVPNAELQILSKNARKISINDQTRLEGEIIDCRKNPTEQCRQIAADTRSDRSDTRKNIRGDEFFFKNGVRNLINGTQFVHHIRPTDASSDRQEIISLLDTNFMLTNHSQKIDEFCGFLREIEKVYLDTDATKIFYIEEGTNNQNQASECILQLDLIRETLTKIE